MLKKYHLFDLQNKATDLWSLVGKLDSYCKAFDDVWGVGGHFNQPKVFASLQGKCKEVHCFCCCWNLSLGFSSLDRVIQVFSGECFPVCWLSSKVPPCCCFLLSILLAWLKKKKRKNLLKILNPVSSHYFRSRNY